MTYALSALTLAWPALAGRFLVSPVSDQYLAGYPLRAFAAQAMHETGAFALWNPYLFGGMPYVASMNGDIFYPTFFLRLVLGVDVGMTWGMILHLFLAGVFTYGFLRTTGRSFAASLIGGLAYMMGGQVASLVSAGHDGKLFIAALFPLMLLALTWGIRDHRRWAWGLLALISGLGVLTPHPQLYQYMLLGAGAYGVMLAFDGSPTLDRRTALTRLGFALGAILLGWAIGAIQYVPVFEYVDWSPRAGGKGWEHAVSYSMPPEELINTVIPQFSGILDNYWGRNGIHLHSEYVGAVVLFLAGAGFWWGRRKESWFWVGFLVISLLWSLGGYTPFYKLVYALVPGAKYFRAPSTFFFLCTFAIAVFASRGTDRLIHAGFTRRYIVGWLAAGGVLALLAMTGDLREAFVGLAPDQLMDLFDDPESRRALGLGGVHAFLILLGAAGIAIALARRLVTADVAALLLGAVLVIDLWSVERLYWRFSAPARDLYASDAIIDAVQAQPEPGRVLALPVKAPPAGRDPFLMGDAYMVHGLRLVKGYHGNEIGRYDQLTAGDNIWNPVFWQLANVRWMIYNDSTPLFPGLERVMGPVTNAAGTPTWLFRVPGDNPAAWIVPAIMKQPDDVTSSVLRDPRFPVRSVALFAPEAAVTGQALTEAPAPLAISARIPTYEPGHIAVELGAPAPSGSALVVSENFYPGWSASVDGKPATVYRANLSLMGIPLPEGASRIELRFTSATFERGKWITIVATLLALGAVGAGMLPRRRVDG